ncbi:hypothetical protein IW262DRAFT_1027228 [Armillaria fumosa]|nr:hypothetical protein IW262DRAFT_1027228 [Armillaria fumosa]
MAIQVESTTQTDNSSRTHPIRKKSLILLTSLHFSSWRYSSRRLLQQVLMQRLRRSSLSTNSWRPGPRVKMPKDLYGCSSLPSCYLALSSSWLLCASSIERDWATTIGQGDTVRLMKVNTWLRRIDLICKLISPLFVSMLTTAVSYRFATALLCGVAVVTAYIEIPLSQIVYNLFPALESEYQQRLVNTLDAGQKMHNQRWIDPGRTFRDWREFSRLPVFYTSLSISSIYFTVLSFDGTFLSYLKATRD